VTTDTSGAILVYYRTYVNVWISLTAAFIILLSILSVLALGILAIIAIPVIAIGLVLGCYFHIAWVTQGLDSFDGTPMPGFFGLMGVEIVPDGTDLSQVRHSVPDYDRNELPGFSDSLPDPSAPPARPIVKRGCPKCGAVTEGVDPRVCRSCGGPL